MSSVAVGANGSEPKRRRLLDAGGPVEDDETARRKMRRAKVYERGVIGEIGDYDGFDPGNVGDIKSLCRSSSASDTSYHIEPMGYFARRGRRRMMRWLYVNGADTRDEDVPNYFPMFSAALNGHFETCKWLFAHGAAEDVKRRTNESHPPFPKNGRSPLYASFTYEASQNFSRWLILNGALCKDDDSGELDGEIMKCDLGSGYARRGVQERKALLKWAVELHGPRTSSLLFLSGALSRPKHAYSTRRNICPVRLLSGEPGIRKLIGDYVGFVRGREARIIRQLTEMLPSLIQELDG